MTYLIANLSTGKGSWAQIYRMLEEGCFDKAFLITNDFGVENFKKDARAELIVVDTRKDAFQLSTDIFNALKGKIDDTEVALNICSGTGSEHMALISAIIKMGVGFRLVDLKDEKVCEL